MSFFELTEKVAEETLPENINDYLIPQMRLGKITDEETVKEASRFFTNNYKKMNMETRVNAAVTLVKKASEYDVEIPTRIYKHAGMTQTNRKVLTEWIDARKEASANNQKISECYEKLASFTRNRHNNLNSRADLLKLSDALYDLDKKANLVKCYDRTLPDPITTVFNTTKLAEDTILLGGKDIPASTLMSLAPENYSDVLGDDIVPEITDDAGKLDQESLIALLKTLPADMQINLVNSLGLK